FSFREGVYPNSPIPPPGVSPVTLGPANNNFTNKATDYEGMDAMGSGKVSVRDTNDSLHFTVRLNGNKRENFFSGKVWGGSLLDVNAGAEDSRYQTLGSGTYSSQWAEVIYFLAPSGEPRPPGQPQLFNLYRRQLLLLPDAFTVGNNIAPTAP